MVGDTFRDRVSAYRRASGHSQDELAAAVGLHPKVLSRKLNAIANAKLTHQEVKRIIRTLAAWRAIDARAQAIALLTLEGLSPSVFSSDEWNALSLTDAPDIPSVPSPRPRPRLPVQPTRLIGRDWVLDHVAQLLLRPDVRLITLLGTGGTGKTRLAYEIIACYGEQFEHGAVFIDLSPVTESEAVAGVVAHALGMIETPQQGPVEWLRNNILGKRMLLVLDNFEQVLGAISLVSELLVMEGIKLLVTSRAALRIYGEWQLSIPPLDLPDRHHLPASVEQLRHYAAAQLFLERAEAARADFAAAPEHIPLIAEVCIRLDGLPLAIELAAARLRLLSLPMLHEQIGKLWRDVLAGGPRNRHSRQQTLWNTIAWSEALLSAEEQRLFARLAVFVDGWTLEAVAEVCQLDEPLFALESLFDQSLMRRIDRENFQTRFGMLETLRTYAAARLEQSDEAASIRRAHAQYFVAFAKQAERGMRSLETALWLARIEDDLANIRAALHWTLGEGQQPELGAWLVIQLWKFWRLRGLLIEGLAWFERVIGMHEQLTTSTYKIVLLHAGSLALRLGHYNQTADWANKVLALSQEHVPEQAWALGILGRVLRVRGEYVAAVGLLTQSLDIFQAFNLKEGQAWALEEIGTQAIEVGNLAHATEAWEDSFALFRELGDMESAARSRENLGRLAWWQGQNKLAQQHWQESLLVYQQIGDRQNFAWLLNSLADLERGIRSLEQADRYYAQSMALMVELGDELGQAAINHNYGYMALARNDPASAAAYFTVSLQIFQKLNHRTSVADCLTGFAATALATAQPELAAQLLGAVAAFHDLIQVQPAWMVPANLNAWEQTLQATRASLGERFDAPWQAGHALSLDQAAAQLVMLLVRQRGS